MGGALQQPEKPEDQSKHGRGATSKPSHLLNSAAMVVTAHAAEDMHFFSGDQGAPVRYCILGFRLLPRVQGLGSGFSGSSDRSDCSGASGNSRCRLCGKVRRCLFLLGYLLGCKD